MGIGPGGRFGGKGVGVGEDEDVAGFFDGLLFGLAVVVTGGVRVGGADVVDCPGLDGEGMSVVSRGQNENQGSKIYESQRRNM